MKQVIVVVPVYKKTLNQSEKVSFKQGLTVLSKHDIAIVCSEHLDIDFYLEFAHECSKQIIVERFEDQFFTDIPGYNKLLLSVNFYKRFSAYKRMLIYQTDAFVFKDELQYWCSKRYDYIGAPWFEGFHLKTGGAQPIGAGNGGVSLRNVSKFKNILSKRDRITAFLQTIYFNKIFKKIPNNYLGKVFKILFGLRDVSILQLTSLEESIKTFQNPEMNEDYFWAVIAPHYFKNFKVANYSEAMYFSFENHPRELYKMTNNQLPFGCHAWEKYDPEFWSDFIYSSLEARKIQS